MKTYEIKYEPTNGNDKYNIYYYDENGNLENKEFHSIDGINGEIRKGYTLKNK